MRFMKKVRLHPLVVFQKHGWSRTHGWAKLFQRFDRRAMAIDPTFVAAAQPRGTAREVCRRQVVNAILYVNRTGCQWRQLPRDFPKWRTVYDLFWHWQLWGLWQEIHDKLRERVRRTARSKGQAQRRDYRQPERAHHGSRRNSWLRCRQKGHRPQTTSGGRYPGADPGRGRASRRCARPGRCPVVARSRCVMALDG